MVMYGRYIRSILSGVGLLPKHISHEVSSSEQLIHDDLEVVRLVVVDGNPDRAVLRQQIAQEFKTRPHHCQPLCRFEIDVVMLEGRAGIIRRVDVDSPHLAGIERHKRLQGFRFVTLDEHVPGFRVAGGKVGGFFQQPKGNASGGVDVGVSCQPIQCRHSLSFGFGARFPGSHCNLGELVFEYLIDWVTKSYIQKLWMR